MRAASIRNAIVAALFIALSAGADAQVNSTTSTLNLPTTYR